MAVVRLQWINVYKLCSQGLLCTGGSIKGSHVDTVLIPCYSVENSFFFQPLVWSLAKALKKGTFYIDSVGR